MEQCGNSATSTACTGGMPQCLPRGEISECRRGTHPASAEKLNRLAAARIVAIANCKVIDDPQFEPCSPHLSRAYARAARSNALSLRKQTDRRNKRARPDVYK